MCVCVCEKEWYQKIQRGDYLYGVLREGGCEYEYVRHDTYSNHGWRVSVSCSSCIVPLSFLHVHWYLYV